MVCVLVLLSAMEFVHDIVVAHCYVVTTGK